MNVVRLYNFTYKSICTGFKFCRTLATNSPSVMLENERLRLNPVINKQKSILKDNLIQIDQYLYCKCTC